MEELGQKLKLAREKSGVSLEEAATDLNIRVSQLENIEGGNVKAFKDVFYLKYFIRDYAKYLGLDFEKLVEEFNDFLFDYTSKIPLQAIKEASEKKKEEPKKVVSPYTLNKKRGLFLSLKHIWMALLVIGIVIFFVIISYLDSNNFKETYLNNSYFCMK